MVGKIPRYDVKWDKGIALLEEDGQWCRWEDVENCLKQSAADEPVFVLVARDMLASSVVRHWAIAAEKAGVPKEKWEEALVCAYAMDVWQKKHGSKLPD